MRVTPFRHPWVTSSLNNSVKLNDDDDKINNNDNLITIIYLTFNRKVTVSMRGRCIDWSYYSKVWTVSDSSNTVEKKTLRNALVQRNQE